MNDDLDLPPFLIIPAAERKAAWKGRKLTNLRQEKPAPWGVPKSMDPIAKKLLREREAERERKETERKKERFAYLKSLRKKP